MRTVVLVVDDNPDMVGVIKHGLEYLHPNEFDVVCANDGEKCFELLNKSCKPDIILLDIMLPGMNGWDIYDKLKRNDLWRNIPIIFISGRNDKVARTAGDVLREEYIEKPFAITNLKERIEKVLEQK